MTEALAVAPPALKQWSFMEARLKTKIASAEMEAKVQKILSPSDVNLLVTGPMKVQKPDGKLLLAYLPGALAAVETNYYYDVLHELRKFETTNRSYASATPLLERYEGAKRADSAPVKSMIVGAIDAAPPYRYCRLTAWTGKEFSKYSSLWPMFEKIGGYLGQHVPDRYNTQMDFVRRTQPEWVITGTPFTTITVNNSYPTGVHTDSGDLAEGFSTLTVVRRGNYSGGWITFPEYRVACDMQDGDLLLMDAHEWHGNTAMTCGDCGRPMGAGVLAKFRDAVPGGYWDHEKEGCKAERISVVAYFRTKMTECGTEEQEALRHDEWAQRRLEVSTVDEMATETLG